MQADLVAALLLDLLREHAPDARVLTWELRILRCLYDTEPLLLFGRPHEACAAELWAEDAQGRVAMEAFPTLDRDIVSPSRSAPASVLALRAPRPVAGLPWPPADLSYRM